MKQFVIGERFADMNDYSNYTYTHLFYHGKLIGKSITDNWQFHMLRNAIMCGLLKKAKLNDGFNMYCVKITVDNFTCEYITVACSKTKAISKIKKKLFCGATFLDDYIMEAEVID